MQKELMGSEAPLTRNSPLNVELEATGAGSPMKELLGEQAALNYRPYNLMPLNDASGRPLKQFEGSDAPLSMTPNRGYESDMSMSNRAWKAGE